MKENLTNKRGFAYAVEISNDETSVVEFLNGKELKTPVYIGCNNTSDLAQACRIAAYKLLERAEIIMHSKEFMPPEIDIENQVKRMLEEMAD